MSRHIENGKQIADDAVGSAPFRDAPHEKGARISSCVIVVENLPVPLDRHVWQQAIALRDIGWRVHVICPKGPGASASRETLEGIQVYRHRLPKEGSGVAGYALEYTVALACEFWFLLEIFFRDGFDVIHACNPPDLIFLVAAPFKTMGVKFVFDHHDLSPELYEVRFGRDLIHRLLLVLEKFSFRMADHVLSSNLSFRDIAIGRGRKRPDNVSVVHTIPDPDRLKRVPPNRAPRKGKRIVVGYLGIIGFQDGLDHVVDAAGFLQNNHSADNYQFVIVGDGPAMSAIRKRVAAAGLEAVFTFTGYLSGEALWAHLSDFDIGVIPDPRNCFNDKTSMNKVFEYSALGIPIAAYALTETVRLLGDAAVYAREDTPQGLANAIGRLISDDGLRSEMGCRAKAAAVERFDWARERASLISAYEKLRQREI